MTGNKSVFKRCGDTLWLHCEGRTYTISLKARGKTGTRSRAELNIDGLLISPMPGKIQKLPVKVGDKVKAGTTACVIEAMKMEYALKAPFDGIIKRVIKQEGDLVQLDEAVIEIEKA